MTLKGVDKMDIASASMTISQANLGQQVEIALTKKVMDVSEDNSMALIKMMEMSANPNLGGTLDVRV